MGSIKNKRTISLSLFYLKYFTYLVLGMLAGIFVAVVVFEILLANEIIYPANYAEKLAQAAGKEIADAEAVSEDLIPELCQYVLFDADGEVKAGNIEKDGIENAWRAVQENVPGINGYYYTVIERDTEYCVLQYKIIAQYKSPVLRRYLLAPEKLLPVIILCVTISNVIITAVCFGRVLKKKLSPLLLATEKIQNQELEFNVITSDIKEIDAVLKAVDDMRAALKKSLESQWQLEQTKREQTLLLAHDLKTPLTLARGNAELLCDTELTEEQKEYVDYIVSSTLQMQGYVQTLIEITRDGYKLRLQNTDVSSFVQEIVEQAKGLCASKSIILETYVIEYSEQSFSIDHDLLMRAIMNVFSNAVEHTPTDGTIILVLVRKRVGGYNLQSGHPVFMRSVNGQFRVPTHLRTNTIIFEVSEENGCIVFSVSDTGSGFSVEALQHATEQFYMDDRSRGSKAHFGIGLFMAVLVMRQHEGQLILDNSKETGGAKVVMKIPCCLV